jgi:DNA-binding FrmR family transcriptional regulator
MSKGVLFETFWYTKAMTNPCHQKRVASLRRVIGQINGVIRMIESREYCVDILNQTKAAKNALKTVETKILETHLSRCVHESFSNTDDANKKIEELIKVLKRN